MKVKVLVAQLCPTICNPVVCPWDSPGKNTGVDCHSLCQGIFPTQELNPSLLYCRQMPYHLRSSVQFSSVTQLCLTLCHPKITARQATLSITNSWSLRKLMSSCPSSRWYHPAISSSVVPFFSCPQSLLASGSFPMSQLLTWCGQSVRVSASESVLPMNTQDWSPLGWTGWISLQSKGLSRVFSNTTVQKHQVFSTQLSSQSNSHIHTWPLEKP